MAAEKRHRVVATAGHVDHGKSTLLRALTGMEPDRFAEERRRGLSLDLGFVWTTLPAADGALDVTAAFVDVPGHERFVPTMLAGAGAAPAALFVVAATDGWSRQSAEHRDVLDLLGVPAVAVAITKAGLVDDDRLATVRDEVVAQLAGTSLAGAPVVVTDAMEERGLDELRSALSSRLTALDWPADVDRPRLWVDRSFSIAGAGTIVTGTLTEGTLARGDEVRLLPGTTTARLRGLQALGEPVERAAPGTRVALNLGGVDHTAVGRGDVVVAGGPWRVTGTADLWVRTVSGHAVEHAGAWHLHVGSAGVPCQVLPVEQRIDPDAVGAVRVVLDRPLALVAGDRVVLRDAGRRATVAGGIVVDPAPQRRPRGRAQRAAHTGALEQLATTDRAGRLVGLTDLASGALPVATAMAAVGWPEHAPLPAGLTRTGEMLVSDRLTARWEQVVSGLGGGTHGRAAVEAALARDAAGTAGSPARPQPGPAALREAPDHLVNRGALVRVADGYALPDQAETAVTERQRRAQAAIARLEQELFGPPDLQEVARSEGLDHREVAALVQSGAVVRCGPVAFSRRAVEVAVERLRDLQAESGPFTAAAAKERLGTTRRYAIPLLEHLDRTGATRFDGQRREVRADPPAG